MAYHYSRNVHLPYDTVVEKITANLQQQGFAAITCIDVQNALQQALKVPFRKYKVLGAFHPAVAYKAISLESHAGLIFPCHLIVQEHENGQVEVSSFSPLEILDKSSATDQLKDLAREVDNHLRFAIDDLHRSASAPGHAEALPTDEIKGTPTIQG